MLATVALATNVENPLYAPAQLDFYSKTGFSFMYKQSDANLAMKAKDWEYHSEYIVRGYEDFGFGITDRFNLRGAFGYTHDFSIKRSGPHNARLGLGYRAINQPKDAVVWDLYADAWLGGISKMKAKLIASESKLKEIRDSMPLSFKYDNYANGRWGIWLGTVVGKTWDRFTLSAFGEVQKTFGNDNSQIEVDGSAKPVINAIIKGSTEPKIKAGVMPKVKAGIWNQVAMQVCNQAVSHLMSPEECVKNLNEPGLEQVKGMVDAMAPHIVDSLAPGMADSIANYWSTGIAKSYVSGLPNDFSVETKGVWDYVAGLKTSYEIDNNWSMGGGFTWRHRGTNSVKALNIKADESAINKKLDEIDPAIRQSGITAAALTDGLTGSFEGSMEDGVEEFTLTLLGSRNITKNLQVTLFGECTFDTAEDKAQLGSDVRAEVGLRMNWQF